jgi:hypothetical protein
MVASRTYEYLFQKLLSSSYVHSTATRWELVVVGLLKRGDYPSAVS